MKRLRSITMTSIQDHVHAAISAVQQDQDAQQHTIAVARKLEDVQIAKDMDAAEELLQTLHDRLLLHDGAGMQPQAEGDAVLDNIMTECLDSVALLANLSVACHRLAQSLVMRYACCAPREASILLLACLGRQCGYVQAAAQKRHAMTS
jgi:hypothetical protein